MENMQVIKRNGTSQPVSLDKITDRIKSLCQMEPKLTSIDPIVVSQKICSNIYNRIPTTEIDTMASLTAAALSTKHFEYADLAGRIAISNLQKQVPYDMDTYISHVEEILSDETIMILKKYDWKSIIDTDRDFLISFFGCKTLLKAYLLKTDKQAICEPIQYMWLRVSIGIHGDDFDAICDTYHAMSSLHCTHATPTLFHAGTKRPQLLSCFLLGIEDSVTGIYKALTDCAHISKWGGGIGVWAQGIRSNGSRIRGTNGITSGITPMLKVFNDTARYINQSGKRNGSFAIYLEPWHSDVFDFLDAKKNHGDENVRARDLFYALWIPDIFMKRVLKNESWTLFCPDECKGLADTWGDDFDTFYLQCEAEKKGKRTVPARELWNAIIDSQIETGTPYMLYKDAANRKSNQQNLGTIRSSNLCVAPETVILTNNGYQNISSLENKNVSVWNGFEFSDTIVRKTGVDQKLIKVVCDNGSTIECTPYHKFHIQVNYRGKQSIKEAQQLKKGDKLIKCELPVLKFDKTMTSPYTHGFFCGDGTYGNTGKQEKQCSYTSQPNSGYCKRHMKYQNDSTVSTPYCSANSYTKSPMITLYHSKMDLVDHLDIVSKGSETNNRITVVINPNIEDKYFVPLQHSLQTKLQWFAGVCDADGSISINGTNKSIQIVSIHHEFLTNIRYMLHECGIESTIKQLHPSRMSYLPKNDGSGEYKYYQSKESFRILINSSNLYKLQQLGFKCNRLDIAQDEPQRNATRFTKITEVMDEGRIDDTYCFTEPKNHTGIFNGIITGQCSEIIEYSDHKEYACCTLASIALPRMIDADGKYNFHKLGQVARTLTRNLNKVVDRNYYPVAETKISNERHRPIGIGVQGLADVYCALKLPFESPEAAQLNKEIFACMYYHAMDESCRIAQRDGPYSTFEGSPLSKGKFQFDLWGIDPVETLSDGYVLKWDELRKKVVAHGVRNSLLIAPMPTASTSQILGNTECFEPYTSNIFTRRTLAGDFMIVNQYLQKDLIKMGLWDDTMKDWIISNRGSIQPIPGIPKRMKDVYKTAWEMSQKALIDQAADRGAYICQSQSLNLFMNDPNHKKIGSMHMYSWKKGLKTGQYYLRTRPKAFAQQFTVDPDVLKKLRALEVKDEDEGCLMCGS